MHDHQLTVLGVCVTAALLPDLKSRVALPFSEWETFLDPMLDALPTRDSRSVKAWPLTELAMARVTSQR